MTNVSSVLRICSKPTGWDFISSPRLRSLKLAFNVPPCCGRSISSNRRHSPEYTATFNRSISKWRHIGYYHRSNELLNRLHTAYLSLSTALIGLPYFDLSRPLCIYIDISPSSAELTEGNERYDARVATSSHIHCALISILSYSYQMYIIHETCIHRIV